MKLALPWYESQGKDTTHTCTCVHTHTHTIKLRANITDEHRFENFQQNISKPNPTIHWKDHIPQSSWIFPEMQGWFNICKSVNIMHHINKLEDKNHMIISIDGEKAFDNLTYIYYKKNSQQRGCRGNLPQHN